MLLEHYYKVAGFPFVVSLPAGRDADRLLPSCGAFRLAARPDDGELLFRLTAGSEPLPEARVARLLDETTNDLGRVRLSETSDGYRVELSYCAGGPVHELCADRTFRTARACLRWDDRSAGAALNSLLRIVYSLAVPFRGGVSIHAAAVALGGRAWLFMGKSGTGKSTHAALWRRCFAGCELLNDDNPTVRVEKGGVYVYGTPWSGKTPCYRNLCYPLGGAVRLRQAGTNRFVRCADVEAFATLLPGCSFIRDDRAMCEALYDTLARVAESVTVGTLECRPDEEAARLCAAALHAVGPATR